MFQNAFLVSCSCMVDYRRLLFFLMNVWQEARQEDQRPPRGVRWRHGSVSQGLRCLVSMVALSLKALQCVFVELHTMCSSSETECVQLFEIGTCNHECLVKKQVRA